MNEKKFMNCVVDNICILVVLMVEKVNLGYLGGVMGGVDFVNVFFFEFLVYDFENLCWEGCDCFFFDLGYMLLMLYFILVLIGKFIMEELV